MITGKSKRKSSIYRIFYLLAANQCNLTNHCIGYSSNLLQRSLSISMSSTSGMGTRKLPWKQTWRQACHTSRSANNPAASKPSNHVKRYAWLTADLSFLKMWDWYQPDVVLLHVYANEFQLIRDPMILGRWNGLLLCDSLAISWGAVILCVILCFCCGCILLVSYCFPSWLSISSYRSIL